MKTKTKLLLCSLGISITVLTGCVAQMVTDSQDRHHYSEYVERTNQLNTEREKNGLAPVHVMTFDEWSGNKK